MTHKGIHQQNDQPISFGATFWQPHYGEPSEKLVLHLCQQNTLQVGSKHLHKSCYMSVEAVHKLTELLEVRHMVVEHNLKPVQHYNQLLQLSEHQNLAEHNQLVKVEAEDSLAAPEQVEHSPLGQ